MKAMILAAGMGTRLKPLTDTMPKALVPVDGIPMIERLINLLRSKGFDSIVVNVHHFHDMLREFLSGVTFDGKIAISDESDCLLDTGGGLVHAAPLLFDDQEFVLVHNVDILSNADITGLIDFHIKSGADATLLVSSRNSSRKLIFDNASNLEAWHNLKEDSFRPDGFKPTSSSQELAFSGIYVIGKKCVEEMARLMGEGKYSVIDYFLHPERKSVVKGYQQQDLTLLDIGKPATLSQAPVLLKNIFND